MKNKKIIILLVIIVLIIALIIIALIINQNKIKTSESNIASVNGIINEMTNTDETMNVIEETSNIVQDNDTEYKTQQEEIKITTQKSTQKQKTKETTKSSSNKSSKLSSNNQAKNNVSISDKTSTNTTTTTTKKHIHSKAGTSGKWVSSYDQIEKEWLDYAKVYEDKLEKGSITWEEYCAKCPNGYKNVTKCEGCSYITWDWRYSNP